MDKVYNTKVVGSEETIGIIMGLPLIKSGNDLYYDTKQRIPEITLLARVDFSYLATFRFTAATLKSPKFAKLRTEFFSDIFMPINRRLLEKNPDLICGKHSIRYVWVEEYGESDDIHVHLLLYIDERIRPIVIEDIRLEMEELEKKPLKGVESIVIKEIKDQVLMAAYPFKIERDSHGRKREKSVYYSLGFFRVLERHYPCNLLKNSDKNGKNEVLIEQNI